MGGLTLTFAALPEAAFLVFVTVRVTSPMPEVWIDWFLYALKRLLILEKRKQHS